MSDYETYRQWKHWDSGELTVPQWLQHYFRLELERAGLAEAKTFLEIGFGNGEFLQWLKQRGCNCVGVEIIPELVEAGRKRGFDVHAYDMVADEANPDPFADQKFDAVVAFDVAEHLSVEQLQRLFRRLNTLLAPNGKVILRFPNGESPFSAPIQNGDHTHQTYLSLAKLKHLCIGSGLEVENYFNASRVPGKRKTAWVKWLIFKLRDLCELTIGALYYNRRRPLDPVATAVLIKNN